MERLTCCQFDSRMIKWKIFLNTGFMRHVYYGTKLRMNIKEISMMLCAWCRWSWHWLHHPVGWTIPSFAFETDAVVCSSTMGLACRLSHLPPTMHRAEDGQLVEIHTRCPYEWFCNTLLPLYTHAFLVIGQTLVLNGTHLKYCVFGFVLVGLTWM